jgi:hypothetical protein
VNKDRLLNVARALREAKTAECDFDMSFYVHECGTPACALGHYAARRDLQDRFKIVVGAAHSFLANASDGRSVMPGDVAGHFAISIHDAGDLFDVDGCGGAKTPAVAAAFIEAFVARNGEPRS